MPPGFSFLGQRPELETATLHRRESDVKLVGRPEAVVAFTPLDWSAAEEYLYPQSAGQEFRPYQHAMAKGALCRNTLIALPTGLGKTMIASVVLLNYWRWFPRDIVVFMAPTRPLVAQQAQLQVSPLNPTLPHATPHQSAPPHPTPPQPQPEPNLAKPHPTSPRSTQPHSPPNPTQQLHACCAAAGLCPQRDARMITGADPPAKRRALWAGARGEEEEVVRGGGQLQGGRRRIFFCTPQTLGNDLGKDIVDGRRICCLCIDEAHHAASANYGYSVVLRRIREVNQCVHVLGLSATAGADLSAIQRVVNELNISRIETRCEDDAELQRLMHQRLVHVHEVACTAGHAKSRSMRALILQPGAGAAARLQAEGCLRTADATTLGRPDLDSVRRAVSSHVWGAI